MTSTSIYTFIKLHKVKSINWTLSDGEANMMCMDIAEEGKAVSDCLWA